MDALEHNNKKFRRNDLSPELVEQATMEIIKESMRILKSYELKGVITNIEIGLLPIHRKTSSTDQSYALSYDDLFSLLINRKK